MPDWPHNVIRHHESPSSLFMNMWKNIGSEESSQCEMKSESHDDSHYWIFATVVPVFDVNINPAKYINIHINIIHKKK